MTTIAEIKKMTLAECDALTSVDTADWTPAQKAAFDRHIRRLLDELFNGTAEERIAEALRAIRSDDIVGRYTCSMVDEAMSDAEVIAEFILGANGKPVALKTAVRRARAAHALWAQGFSECW